MTRAGWALLLLLGCGAPGNFPGPDKRCQQTSECPSGSVCAVEPGLCISPAASSPYPVVLQLTELGEQAGGLARFTLPARSLTESSETADLDVPPGVRVEGRLVRVRGATSEPVVAEVWFTPRLDPLGFTEQPFVVASRTVNSLMPTLVAVLPKDTTFDVMIYPLGKDSFLPPARTTFASTGAPFSFAYDQLEQLDGVLLDEAMKPQEGRRVRMLAGQSRDPANPGALRADEVVSSSPTVDAAGKFSLTVLPGVIGKRDYVLEVSLYEQEPWASTIEVDAARVEAAKERVVQIPVVPAVVDFAGLVETKQAKKAPFADLSFITDFPVPDFEGAVNDRDWCRAKTLGDKLPAYRCKSRVPSTTGVDGKFAVKLLPGNYKVYVTPSREPPETQRALAIVQDQVISTQLGGVVQGGQLYRLGEALFVDGAVFGLDGAPLENVLIELQQLTGPGGGYASGTGKSSGISDARGAFKVFVDRGYFDLVARAGEDAGYPWLYKANRVIEESLSINNFVMPAPVLLAGQLTSAGLPLVNATVGAYAVVRDLQTPGQKRGALIATATSDENGRYVLKLPPSVADQD